MRADVTQQAGAGNGLQRRTGGREKSRMPDARYMQRGTLFSSVSLALMRLRRGWNLLVVVGIGILVAVVLICTVPLIRHAGSQCSTAKSYQYWRSHRQKPSDVHTQHRDFVSAARPIKPYRDIAGDELSKGFHLVHACLLYRLRQHVDAAGRLAQL